MITPCYTPAGGLTRLLSVLHSFPPASLISVPLRSHPLHHSSHAALTAAWHASLFHHERFFTVLHVPPRYKIHILAAPDLRDGAARLQRDKESAAEFQFSAGASTRTRRTPGEGAAGGGGQWRRSQDDVFPRTRAATRIGKLRFPFSADFSRGSTTTM